MLYSPSPRKVQEIVVPPLQFAMIDGEGSAARAESSPAFQNAIGALYGATFSMKFARKKAQIEPDYTICPLECLWWMVDGLEFDSNRPADWRWTLMLCQPVFISQIDFKAAVAGLETEKPSTQLRSMRLEPFDEGRVVQIMHIGAYPAQVPAIEKLREFARNNSNAFRGKLHKIYLGDLRRVRPEKLRTILRHPIA